MLADAAVSAGRQRTTDAVSNLPAPARVYLSMETIGGFDISAGTRFRRHEHATTHVCAVLAGGFLECDAGGWRDVGPGMLRVSGGARHDCDFGPKGARCLLLELDDDALPAPDAPRFLAADGWLERLAGRIDAASSSADPAARFSVPGLAAELLAQIARRLGGRATPAPPWLARIRERLHDTGGTASVEELAADAGVHRVHLARTFRDHLGVPVTLYARRLRLETARRNVERGVPLAQAAARAGFADQSHLTRTMRAAWGITPGELRRTLPAFKTALPRSTQVPGVPLT